MENLIVSTKYGKIAGVQEDCLIFKGIPYAKPPVGALRFSAPEVPDAWDGIRRADCYPNRCAQVLWDDPAGFYKKEFYMDREYATPVSEDGLYLNVRTPSADPSGKMPVFFYIHGGGFIGGCGHEVEFRTAAYAKKGVVLVTINYRLGIFGYLAHPWLTAEDPSAVGNYALLDQIAALKWVKENIGVFGGDPENVTICGQSAGGMNVEALLASRCADGLYQHAIIQSASGYPSFVANVKSLREAEEMGKKALEEAGITSLSELRSASAETLLEVQGRMVADGFASGSGLPFAPVVNGFLLKEGVTEAIAGGHMNKVPVIIGCTKDDITVTPEEAAACDSKIHRSDIAFSLKAEESEGNPAYVYLFTRDLPGDDSGAFHSGELWYTMGTLEKSWRPMTAADLALSEEMVTRWCSFAKTGSPNAKGLTRWELCTKKDPQVKTFDIGSV